MKKPSPEKLERAEQKRVSRERKAQMRAQLEGVEPFLLGGIFIISLSMGICLGVTLGYFVWT